MPYLYASAVIMIQPRRIALGPTALQYLADTVMWHLDQQERFTLYFDWRYWDSKPHWRRGCARQAQVAAYTIEEAVRSCYPYPIAVEWVEHNRFSLAARFVPANEWHPAPPVRPGPPVTLYCDASRTDEQVRGGIAVAGTTYTIDLTDTGITRSSDAEFLTVCLALLTAAGERSPLTVYADQTEAVCAGQMLGEGLMPRWVYLHGSELAQRIVVAAMTASRLRPIRVEQIPRNQVHRAHVAADATVTNEHMLTSRNWARRQGLPLSWKDWQRGLNRCVYSSPAFQARAGLPSRDA